MRFVIQRCSRLKITANGQCTAFVEGAGLLLLVAWGKEDETLTEEVMKKYIQKIIQLRIFPDKEGKMNLSVKDVQGYVGIVSNFTLYGSMPKGHRPSFSSAASPDLAKEMYEKFCKIFHREFDKVYEGIFAADMQIDFINDGPVTILYQGE